MEDKEIKQKQNKMNDKISESTQKLIAYATAELPLDIKEQLEEELNCITLQSDSDVCNFVNGFVAGYIHQNIYHLKSLARKSKIFLYA